MRRGMSSTVIAAAIGMGVVVIAIFALTGGGGGSSAVSAEAQVVERGGFDITVPTSGQLAALMQIDIRNELENNAVITELIDEGSLVAKGDVLLRLNDEEIRNSIRDAEDAVTAANNDLETATASLAIAKKRRDSELAAKQLAIDLADLSLQAWREGEVVARRQQLDLAATTAKKNYDRLKEKYESSLRLYEQKFISKDELDRDEIDLLNAEAAMKRASLDVEVYENYTFKQQKQVKESNLQQAGDEMDRSTDRLKSELRSVEANKSAKEKRLDNNRERLDKLQRQLDMCVVLAPAPGMVVYATSIGDRREWDEQLKVGRSLHRNEKVMVIPDTSQMVAEVKVNEALSGLIEPGQLARITCDALPDASLSGEVIGIGVLAEGGGWRDPNRRDYTVRIRVDNPEALPLKPSMRCSAEILVGRVDDVLVVPVHAIHRDGSTAWVWKQDGGGFSQQPVKVGRFSESFVSIYSGLVEGDEILLQDPPPGSIVSRLDTEG